MSATPHLWSRLKQWLHTTSLRLRQQELSAQITQLEACIAGDHDTLAELRMAYRDVSTRLHHAQLRADRRRTVNFYGEQ